ncbi:MAG: hypothetical protein ABJG78_09655 [Cyclobacteriaceae bacterium]
MKYISLLLCVGLFLQACESEDPSTHINVSATSGIDLRNLKSGQESKYVLYQSDCSANFQFTGDTLVVEVITRNDSLFLQESYTDGSQRERSVQHTIIPKDGYILIPQRFTSEFLFFYGNDTIYLDKPATTQLIQNGCQLMENSSPFIGNAIGSVQEFQFGTMRVTDTKGISCVPGSFNVEAYIFYTDHLNAVHIVQEGLVENVFGFMAIE